MQSITNMVAQEQSTFVISLSFTDETGAAVIPESIDWSLVDKSGTVINSLEDESVAAPAESIDIVLTGDDLQITDAEHASGVNRVMRYLIIEATYNSDLGLGLTLKDEISFLIENIKKVETETV